MTITPAFAHKIPARDQTENPLAFPGPLVPEGSGGAPGMALRDWFAGQAISGMMASEAGIQPYLEVWAAERAYLLADAMLAARQIDGTS